MEKAARKRKGRSDESELSTFSAQLKTRRLTVAATDNSSSSSENSGNSTCDTVVVGDHVSASCCCSSNGSSELEKGSSKFVDLEENEAAHVEFCATSAGDDSLYRTERRDDAQAESGELESTARPHETHLRRRSTSEKMPSEAELEEFFAAAEKNIHKQFIDKYNYDIAKDEPLEGRYEWVQLQLNP